ncbi:MAG: hypothetical protein R3C05_29500 [Pirellulaceae bacterium]
MTESHSCSSPNVVTAMVEEATEAVTEIETGIAVVIAIKRPDWNRGRRGNWNRGRDWDGRRGWDNDYDWRNRYRRGYNDRSYRSPRYNNYYYRRNGRSYYNSGRGYGYGRSGIRFGDFGVYWY